MINAGKRFREGFLQLLKTFGGTVVIIKDFKCSNSSQVEVKGMKNSKKDNSSIIMFQFPDKQDIVVGDVIQQKGSSEYWKVYETEEKITTDIFVYFIAYVNKIDSNGNRI